MKLALICGAAFMALGIPHGTNNHAKTILKDTKINQSFMLDGTSYLESDELISTMQSSAVVDLPDDSVSDYNIVSKNLVTGTLAFINFDEEFYYYRQFAYDEDSSTDYSTSTSIIPTNISTTVAVKSGGNGILFTEGYNPMQDVLTSSMSTRDVIGDDDRIPVSDTTQWPYRAVGYLSMRFDVINNETGHIDQRYFMGTGFLEGPDLLITAGHCLYGDVTKSYTDNNNIVHTEYEDNLNNPRFPDAITYYPARNGASLPYGSVSVERVYIEKSYYLNTEKDWGCCKLSSPIGNTTGWFGKISNFYIQNYPFMSYGYPGSQGGNMYEASAQFTYFETDNGWYYRTNLDSEGGQSGSPYRISLNGGNFVSGIHTYTVGNLYTGGIRIDSFMFAFMNSFVAGNYEHNEIVPTDYGFADAYPTDNPTKTNYLSHTVGDLDFKTRRYRTGYIHNEYIVMSAIKTGITEAYIEYRFTEPVRRIDVELCHWRELSHEWLSASTGTAELQTIDNTTGEWQEELDLLNDIDMPRDRTQIQEYQITFSQPVYRFRFYASVNSPYISDSNRGRICIGDMWVWTAKNYNYLPLSGSENVYDSTLWAGSVSNNSNCYAYALNNQVYPGTNNLWFKQQPGQYAGSTCTNYTKSELVAAVTADFEEYNDTYGTSLVFQEVGKNDRCPSGTYKVALVSCSYDYHWYRQDADGYWSHKPGTTPVRLTDNSGNLILDPAEADLGIYTNFLGYFAISPWNNLYSA